MTVAESATYTEGIYQIELTDPVIGGADGIANLQAKQLANRTNWLKAAFEKIVDGTTSIAKALKLATARKISLGGALSGSANFDGSADITIEASFANGVLTINSINGLSDALNGLTNAKQPLDATLTALANLTTVANKLIYATGSDSFNTTDLTAFARTLLAGASGSAIFRTLGATENIANSGFFKLPNGLIIQWGTGIAAIGSTTVTFPIAFPIACLHVMGAAYHAGVADGCICSLVSNTTNQATFFMFDFTNGNLQATPKWLAIGY